jgi:hypothetical protein
LPRYDSLYCNDLALLKPEVRMDSIDSRASGNKGDDDDEIEIEVDNY